MGAGGKASTYCLHHYSRAQLFDWAHPQLALSQVLTLDPSSYRSKASSEKNLCVCGVV